MADNQLVVELTDSPTSPLLILAHGAGGDMNSRTIVALKNELLRRGISVARFNFLYKQLGKSMPDRMPVLIETYRSVAEALRSEHPDRRLFCGGHSMGGRTASMLAAAGYSMDGLILMAYPLHPSGQPEKLRVDHLHAITCPTLCLNGTNDALCTSLLMEEALRTVGPNWTMHWLEGADHSYHVPKSSGRTDGEVLEEIGESVAAFIGA